MQPEDHASLEVRDLSIDFLSPRGPVQALRNISLDVPRGRILGVVGESGCGKSTLVHAVIGLLAANARISGGKIDFDGRNLLTLDDTGMRALRGQRISMIFQDPMTALNPVLSIEQQMLDIQYRAKESRRAKRKRALEMLNRVGIPDPESRLKSYPHQFSGGMRQRIAIAMALLVEPDLLLADEPTTALDATLEVQIIHLLQNLQRDIGCSIMFVSHHLGTVAELCHDMVVMYAGEVVERGSVRDVFHRASHPYTQALLQCDPGRIREATRHLPTISGSLPDLVELPAGCIFKGRCPHAFDKCDTVTPPHYRAGEGHTASCHLLETEEVPA